MKLEENLLVYVTPDTAEREPAASTTTNVNTKLSTQFALGSVKFVRILLEPSNVSIRLIRVMSLFVRRVSVKIKTELLHCGWYLILFMYFV